MLLGHFGVALGVRRWSGRVSLGVLVLAAGWADLLWPLLVFAGVERVATDPGITAFNDVDFVEYPWSHSLLLGVAWGVVLGGAYYAWRRHRGEAAVVGALVTSHWPLDYVVHRPDLPVWPGGPEVGLTLWNSVVGTLAVEVGLLAAGATLYLTATIGEDRVGRVGGYAFPLLLLVVFLGTAFGPTPADGESVAVGALALWLAVPIAWWIDDHRGQRFTTMSGR